MRNPFKRRPTEEEKALTATRNVVEALQDRLINPYPALGGTNLSPAVAAAWQRGMEGAYGWIYATQPAVRSVIDFIARNSAQLTLKLYEVTGPNERERVEDHAAAEALEYPDEQQTRESFLYRVFTDYLIWDNAYILKVRSPSGRLYFMRLPPNGVQVAGGRFTVDTYIVWRYDGTQYQVKPDDMIHWYGFHPDDPLQGLSKLETLRSELATDRALQATMVDLAKNDLKGGYIKRPLEAPELKQEGIERIAEMWRAGKLRGDPILDEGMEFVQSGMSPKDAELMNARRYTKEEVASLYGVPLAAMGVGEADPAEQRKLVYQDVLPPLCDRLARQLTIDVLRAEYGENDIFWEFDYQTKLRGDLENRYPQFTAAAGAPWQTRNEVRAKEGLPPIEGGDDLITPLNVTAGNPKTPALPAPNVMPPQQPLKPPQGGEHRAPGLPPAQEPTKAVVKRVPNLEGATVTDVLEHFYDRQLRAIKARGNGGEFDLERWDRELAEDLELVIGEKAAPEMAYEINRVTERALDGTAPEEAFARLREDVVRWSADIDRARVMLVAASLLDASQRE